MTAGSATEPSYLGDASIEVDVLLGQAEESRQRGEYQTGVDLARQAVALARSRGGMADCAQALNSLGNQLHRLGAHEEAVTSHRDAISLLEMVDDEEGICRALTSQAVAFNTMGLHEEALEALTRAREIALRRGDKTLLYWVHNRTGVVHGSMGDYLQGNACLLRALPMVDGMDVEARFCILNNLADNVVSLVPTLRSQGEYNAAEEALAEGLRYVDEAQALAHAANHPFRTAICLDNYGMLLSLAGDHTRGLDMIEEAQRIAIERGYRAIESWALQHQAQIRRSLGDTAAAIESLLAALERAISESGTLPMVMAIHKELSEAYSDVGEFAAALDHYRQFHMLERRARSDTASARARLMVHHFELDNARLEADNARLEAELHRLHNRELEEDKRALQREAQELDRRAHEDELTGLANRRHAELRLPEMIAAVDADRRVCAAIADVDLFKGVNDRFGHLVGDEVLRRLAKLLRENVRGSDLVARLGGEEFLIVFDGVDLADGYRRCERLRAVVAEYQWDRLRAGLRVTISIGVAEHRDGNDHRDLLARADTRLYRAKRAGRNRVAADRPIIAHD